LRGRGTKLLWGGVTRKRVRAEGESVKTEQTTGDNA